MVVTGLLALIVALQFGMFAFDKITFSVGSITNVAQVDFERRSDSTEEIYIHFLETGNEISAVFGSVPDLELQCYLPTSGTLRPRVYRAPFMETTPGSALKARVCSAVLFIVIS